MKLARIRTVDGVVTGEYDDGVVPTEGETYALDEIEITYEGVGTLRNTVGKRA